jgi:hypothetical protein
MAAFWEADAIAFWRVLHTLARVCQLRAPGVRTTFYRGNISDVTPALQVDLSDSAAVPIDTIKGRGRKRFVSNFPYTPLIVT